MLRKQVPIVSPAARAADQKLSTGILAYYRFNIKKGLAESNRASTLDSWFRSSDLKHGNPAGSNRRGLPFLGFCEPPNKAPSQGAGTPSAQQISQLAECARPHCSGAAGHQSFALSPRDFIEGAAAFVFFGGLAFGFLTSLLERFCPLAIGFPSNELSDRTLIQ
jgi:hypothetical protein